MATAPLKNEDATATVMQINPDDILIGERIGLFWPDKAKALGKLIAQDGQDTPINVRKSGPRAEKPWTLVVGHHRLVGVKDEGLRSINAIEVFGDAEELREMEARENIYRRDFAPIERACFVRAIADAAEARMKGQHEGLSQQQIAIRKRWEEEKAKASEVARLDDLADAEADFTRLNLNRVYGWRDEVAGALGLSVAAVKRDLALHRALIAPFPDLYRDLAKHPIVGSNASALREIASVKDAPNRRRLIEAIIGDEEATVLTKKLELGLKTLSGNSSATGATKFMNGTLNNIDRLSFAELNSLSSEIVNRFKKKTILSLKAAVDAKVALMVEKGELTL